jgi:hypothetical protein
VLVFVVSASIEEENWKVSRLFRDRGNSLNPRKSVKWSPRGGFVSLLISPFP